MVTIRVSTHQWEGSASIVETSSLTPQRWSLTRSAAPAWSSIYVAEWALLENVTFLDAHDVAEVITSTADHIDGVRVINRDNDNTSFLAADMVVDGDGARRPSTSVIANPRLRSTTRAPTGAVR
jgi:hypothetical protein